VQKSTWETRVIPFPNQHAGSVYAWGFSTAGPLQRRILQIPAYGSAAQDAHLSVSFIPDHSSMDVYAKERIVSKPHKADD